MTMTSTSSNTTKCTKIHKTTKSAHCSYLHMKLFSDQMILIFKMVLLHETWTSLQEITHKYGITNKTTTAFQIITVKMLIVIHNAVKETVQFSVQGKPCCHTNTATF